MSLASLERPWIVEALEQAALAAVAAATSTDEIEAVRVEYLGRKSALKLALREVRDRETGMTLNAVARAARGGHRQRVPQSSSRAELDRRLSEERVDVTLPVGGYAARPPAPDHADPPRGRGRLPRARLPRRRRPRGRDDALQLRRAQLPARAPRPVARWRPSSSTTRRCSARRRRRRRSGRWRRSSRPSTSSRSAACTAATRRTRRTRRSSTRSRGSRSTRGSRSPT